VDEWVKAAWEAAQATGLTGRWEFWAAVIAAFVLYVLVRRLGPPFWLYLRSIPAPPDPVEKPPAPPIPVDKDGTVHLDQKPPDNYL
jgi:hypothetical protein